MDFRRVKTSCYSVVCPTEPPATVDAVYLVYYRLSDGSLQASGHADDGAYLGDVGFRISSTSAGRSIFPDPEDPLGQGTRVALDENGSIVVLDFLNDALYSYVPPAPWAATPPMKVGADLYWIEYETSTTGQSLSLRLMRADDLVLSGASQVSSGTVSVSFITVGGWTPGNRPTRGHDFTDTHAGVWVSWIDANFETVGWERIVFPLNGGTSEESVQGLQDNVPDVGVRAGVPLGSSQTLQQRTQLEDPPETDAYPTQQWDAPDHGPDTLYFPWGDEPAAIDIAVDFIRSRAYLLTPSQILTYDLTGSPLSFVPLEPRPGLVEAIGLHRLETPIPFTPDTGGEEE